jgi:curli biogenesis system outer membrane secretion channel CsgG
VATEVKPVSIPADPNLPTIVLVVEPFEMAASGVTSGGNGGQTTPIFMSTGGLGAPAVINMPTYGPQTTNPGQQIGPGVSAQLISALSRVGNVIVYDYATYKNEPQKITANMKSGQLGPFLIKGTVTEFAETSDSSTQGESKGPNPGTLMIPYAGPIIYGIDVLKGRKSVTETRHTGMVGLDVRIINPSNGQIVSSFTSEGTFTTLSSTVTQTKGGKTTTSSDYAASALGQAQIAALNKTVTQIHGALVTRQPVLAQR